MKNLTEAYARDLDLNLLRVFAVVAEEGNLTRAAARLYVTQPAISASMRRLTAFIGAELFTRQGHGVALTTRGAELLASARAHLQPLVAAATAGTSFDPRTFDRSTSPFPLRETYGESWRMPWARRGRSGYPCRSSATSLTSSTVPPSSQPSRGCSRGISSRCAHT